MNSISLHDNNNYWDGRAEGYSAVNQEELAGVQRSKWAKYLEEEITRAFPDTDRSQIKVLDMGAGPGFLSIVLTELGYQVTAADYSPQMLAQARANAGELASSISFIREDAMNLSLEDEQFDVLISRNLTWNLPDPKKAYSEWLRVLKPEGLMMVFDANWYAYLYDEEKRRGYEADRANVERHDLEDYNIGENFDVMENIARKLPLTRRHRPGWDGRVLSDMGVSMLDLTSDVGRILYSEKEQINYASTPLFCVRAVKEACRWAE